MRVPLKLLILGMVVAPAAHAQDTSAGSAPDSAFYANLPARYLVRGSSAWEYGVTAFIRRAHLPNECPVVGDPGVDGLLHGLGDLDSLQVDFRQIKPSEMRDSILRSLDRNWHSVNLTAIKAKFEGC
ncbi:MAG TPA: hypothetical protein VFS74_10225 [Gemmatimonadales bacterium]|jgi:hypothetical protein|nr:hypothetical protein [Gemmatimonadales bacterium]